MKFNTLHTIDTEYSADSIEWCPYSDHLGYFVCGTYQLEDADKDATFATTITPACQRKGRIYLYHFNIQTHEVCELQRLETAAILDMKWLPPTATFAEATPILATANALGQLEVYDLIKAQLKQRAAFTLNKNDNSSVPTKSSLLALSLDWNREAQIVVSDSKGNITQLNYANKMLSKIHTWSAHSFEAWICAYDKWNQQIVYTGGDDTFLHAFDLRIGCAEGGSGRLWTNKSHMAGVTCLLSHPHREHLLITGSYDERFRIFDTRAMKRTLCELNLNGGIWRLKAHPKHDALILAACMYRNFSVVRLNKSGDDTVDPLLIGEYLAHESICYGADWCMDVNAYDDSKSPAYMATCSFYDHKLCIASMENEDNE